MGKIKYDFASPGDVEQAYSGTFFVVSFDETSDKPSAEGGVHKLAMCNHADAGVSIIDRLDNGEVFAGKYYPMDPLVLNDCIVQTFPKNRTVNLDGTCYYLQLAGRRQYRKSLAISTCVHDHSNESPVPLSENLNIVYALFFGGEKVKSIEECASSRRAGVIHGTNIVFVSRNRRLLWHGAHVGTLQVDGSIVFDQEVTEIMRNKITREVARAMSGGV